MTDEQQKCVCGHPYSIHRLNRQIGDRNECWAIADERLLDRSCQCRQFKAAAPAKPQGGEVIVTNSLTVEGEVVLLELDASAPTEPQGGEE